MNFSNFFFLKVVKKFGHSNNKYQKGLLLLPKFPQMNWEIQKKKERKKKIIMKKQLLTKKWEGWLKAEAFWHCNSFCALLANRCGRLWCFRWYEPLLNRLYLRLPIWMLHFQAGSRICRSTSGPFSTIDFDYDVRGSFNLYEEFIL